MNTAVILASGKGSKVWPYGVTMVKPVLPVANRPIITWILDALRGVGIERIFIVTTPQGRAQISHALMRDLPQSEGSIDFIIEGAPEGTATSLKKALDVIGEEEMLVIYGDVVTPKESLEKLLDTHAKGGALCTALVQPLLRERPQDWICARVLDGKVQEVIGHARGAMSHRLCGVYALREGAYKYISANPGYMLSVQVGTMPPYESEIGQSIQMMIEDGKSVLASEPSGYFVDVDKPWHILEANYVILEYMANHLSEDVVPSSAEISPHAEIKGKVVMGEGSRIGPRVVIKGNLWLGDNSLIDNGAIVGRNVSIGRGCVVADYCSVGGYTSIGDKCLVTHAAEVGGILMENVHAVHYMEFSGIIGRSSDLGAATVCGTLRFDDLNKSHRVKDRYENPLYFANATYIGDFCRTGVNAILMPGVKIGPYSIVGPGVILMEDVADGTYVSVEQQLVKKSWGPERYGW